jgi:hypothetical protein
MNHHFIDVTLIVGSNGNAAVIADPNPSPSRTPTLPVIEPGDTVTWRFDPKRELQVIFKRVAPAPNTVNPPLFPNTPLGPFSSISLGAGVIVGTVRSDVPTNISHSLSFIYDLAENGQTLQWANNILDGGIDIPRTPP